MNKIIILNWKMNLPDDNLLNFLVSLQPNRLIVAPPIPYLVHLKNIFKNIEFCSQDVSSFKGYGAFTGEFSAGLLKVSGVNYAIIGHSERRNNNWENNKTVKRKVTNCLEEGLAPILCIGETIESRKEGTYKDFLLDQLSHSLPDNLSLTNKIVIAYEPIWAIGTGIKPNNKEIAEVIHLIKNSKFFSGVAKKVKMIYGGSVDSTNIEGLLNIDEIDGVMIGSASLKLEEMRKILNIETVFKHLEKTC